MRAIPPVILRIMLHPGHCVRKPLPTALELLLRRTARCCLSCCVYCPSETVVYGGANVWFVVTGVKFQIDAVRGVVVPDMETVKGAAGGCSY